MKMNFQNKLRRIKVRLLAFESLGVRSMCTYVETPDVKVLIDAGVSLGPRRFGLPPHPAEYKALKAARSTIIEVAEKADVVTISHYHFDHHTPSYTDWAYNWCSNEIARSIYEGKIVLAKSYRSYVNFNQRRRGWIFAQTSGKYAEKLEVADGKSFRFGDTALKFSKPVFHGIEGSDLGWVLMMTLRHEGESILFTSDVQGPIVKETLDLILRERPQLLILGGPPIYLADFRISNRDLDRSVMNMKCIVRSVPVTILDHHILREKKWRSNVRLVLEEAAKSGHYVLTAAEFEGRENMLLESRRKELFKKDPPGSEFIRWMRKPSWERKLLKPPI